jgi:hypothetical protein
MAAEINEKDGLLGVLIAATALAICEAQSSKLICGRQGIARHKHGSKRKAEEDG